MNENKKTLARIDLHEGWETFTRFRDRKLRGVQTGLSSLDRCVFGLSGITVVQGAPGCNKSTLALQVALHQAERGNPVLIVDRENGRERFRMRLLSCANRVSSVDVLTASVERLREFVSKVFETPIYLSTDAPNLAELREMLGLLKEKYRRPIFLVVDSLQALPLLEGLDERLSLQKWVNDLDQLKLDFEGDLTIMVTSEKSRGEGGSNYERARLSSSKGAGAIEYKAELVLDLRRAADGGIVVEVVKNRDGASGVAVVLDPVLAIPTNPSSFCFRLKDRVGVEVL